jgi:hypothetical protein
MLRARLLLPVLLAALVGGCGVGSGEDTGGVGATIVVTRDFGAQSLKRADVRSVPAGETVMRALQRQYDVGTRYGGGFVQSIEGLSAGREQGRPVDWFFYVNGIESEEGAAARELHDGDHVWWDHHDWGTTMRVPAVVGAFPAPFTRGIEGKRFPVRIDCAPSARRECDEVRERLKAAGISGLATASIGQNGGLEVLRVVVGTWPEVRRDPAAAQIEKGVQASGVYAGIDAAGKELTLLDARGDARRTLGAGSGLVAATVFGEQAPAWIVTGTDAAGVAAAAGALTEDVLEGHFAVAVAEGRPIPLPVTDTDPAATDAP